TKKPPTLIAPGADGRLWFTSAYGNNKIFRSKLDGSVSRYLLPTGEQATNYLAPGPDGAMWFADTVTRAIGRITTEGTATEFPILSRRLYPGPITAGPDGNVWFTESAYYRPDKIGRVTPTGTVTEFPLPAGFDDAGEITAGPGGDLWFLNSTSTGDAVGRITKQGRITEFPIRAKLCAYAIAPGPD